MGNSQPGENIKKVTVRLDPDWAPIGVKHFKGLVETGDFENSAVHNVVPGKLAKFGLPAEPLPDYTPIKDDIRRAKNKRGTLVFWPEDGKIDDVLGYGRTNQLAFNLQDSDTLDRKDIQPIGEVMGNGMEVIDQVYSGYGGKPVFDELKRKGNKYLDDEFPKLTKIKSVTISESSEDMDM